MECWLATLKPRTEQGECFGLSLGSKTNVFITFYSKVKEPFVTWVYTKSQKAVVSL